MCISFCSVCGDIFVTAMQNLMKPFEPNVKKMNRLCFMFLSSALSVPALAQPAPRTISGSPIACKAGKPALTEEGFVRIGGIEQWITIKGASCSNPVILMVHGGPGNPNTVFDQLPYAAWEKDFTIVQWDQRGAGRTFTRNPKTVDTVLTLAGLANDGNEVASFVAGHLKVKKIILVGGSWGSALAVNMALARPQMYAAYLGTGQMVNGRENETASYAKMIDLARAAVDEKSIAALEAMGPPPWTNPRHPGAFRRISRVYEAKASTPAPKAWWALAPEYSTDKAKAEYESGEDYSWIQYVGMKGKGMHATLDLYQLGMAFKMPVFLVQGEQDLITTPEVARRYFDAISAPRKEFVLVPATGHDLNPPMAAAQY